MEKTAVLRSLLFVPGDRPERFEKALERGADLVVMDLEDAVCIDRKDAARRMIHDFLERSKQTVCLRINGADTPFSRRTANCLRYPR